MSAIILDGFKRATQLKQDLRSQIFSLQQKYQQVPGLAVLRIGEDGPSGIYVASKLRQCQEVGIKSFLYEFESQISPSKILDQIDRLNQDPQVHAILVQLPFPPHFDPAEIIQALDPQKDVDGLHPFNLGNLMSGHPSIIPCTPRGCLDLLKQHLSSLEGLKALIIGRSILVGRPLAMVLLNENCTVTIAHSKTQDLASLCATADIVIAAVGQPALVKQHWIKPGAVVLDVGINQQFTAEGTSYLQGDVDFQEVKNRAGALTPVPGGIGPMTVVSLLQNTVDLMKRQITLREALPPHKDRFF